MGRAPATGKGSRTRLFVKNVTVYMLVNYREVYVRGMEHKKLLNNNDEQSVL